MAPDIDETPRAAWLKRAHYFALSIAACVLCVSSQVKFAEVQLLELIFAFDLLVLVAWYVLHPAPLRLFRPLWQIGLRWILFSVFALILAVYGLRQDFYPGAVGTLKLPLIVTLSRIAELFLDVFYMLYLAEAYRHDERLRRFAALAYYWVGIAGAVYALISALAMTVGLTLGGAGGAYRLTGFDNEGGPYGTYLLTVILMVAVLRSHLWIGLRTSIASYILLGVALVGSQSKAAIAEAVAFSILIPALRLRGVKLVVTTVSVCLFFVAAYFILDVPARLQQYTAVAEQYETISQLEPDNYNVVAGRVAGLFIAPKMIAAHPLAGIGLGNYPILRDDPAYRHGTPIVSVAVDAPGLGAIDYIVDLGIPLFFYFSWVELAPAFFLVKRRKQLSLICLVLTQPVANWFGSHLNLTYTWIAAGIALGIAYADDRFQMPLEAAQAPTGLTEAGSRTTEGTCVSARSSGAAMLLFESNR